MAKKKRGKANPDTPRGKLQRRVLIWLYEEIVELYAFQRCGGKEWLQDDKVLAERLKVLSQKGVLWTAKRFYNAPPTRSQEATLSDSLHSLEKNGFVVTHDSAGGLGAKPRTKHVKLTELGRDAALFLKSSGGKSQRELEEAQRQTVRALLREIRDLRGELKYRKAHLEQVKENGPWFEMLGQGGTCWDERVPKEAWGEIAEALLYPIETRVAKLEARLKACENALTGPNREEYETGLRALKADPLQLFTHSSLFGNVSD